MSDAAKDGLAGRAGSAFPPTTNAVRCVQCGGWMSEHPIGFWKLNIGPYCPKCWIVPPPKEAVEIIRDHFWDLVESPNAQRLPQN